MIREDSNEYHCYLMLIVKNVTLHVFLPFYQTLTNKAKYIGEDSAYFKGRNLIFQHFVSHYDKDMESLELVNLNDRRTYSFV